MSSGYFPLERNYDKGGKVIAECIEKLQKLMSDYREYACELDCSEDAASDGEYLGKIGVSITLLEGVLRKESSK